MYPYMLFLLDFEAYMTLFPWLPFLPILYTGSYLHIPLLTTYPSVIQYRIRGVGFLPGGVT